MKKILHPHALVSDNNLNVVDIGASGGVHRRWEAFSGNCRKILFEPDPRAIEELKSKIGEDDLIIGRGLARTSGTYTLNLCRKQEVSSILTPDSEMLARYVNPRRYDVVGQQKIEAVTLDSQLKDERIKYVDSLKIDIQGFELEVLRGSEVAVGSAIAIEVEVGFVATYIGQPLFCDVHGYMEDKGFALFDLEKYSWSRIEKPASVRSRRQLIFGNALYIRPPEDLLCGQHSSTKRILRAMSIYLAFGYVDLAYALYDRARSRLSPRSIPDIERALNKWMGLKGSSTHALVSLAERLIKRLWY